MKQKTIAVVPSLAEFDAELARRAQGVRHQQHVDDPVSFAKSIGVDLWSKQRELLESVVSHRKTAVHSAHESGKSFAAALAAAWWIESHPPGSAFVVSTAPTDPQVKAILWREIGRMHRLGGLAGRVNLKEWYIGSELVGLGRKPSEYDATAFQGIHAEYVLLIIDEACGVPQSLWDAGETLVANEFSRVLAIGNPDDPATQFGAVCNPGSGYHVIGISAFETPNFTGEPVSPALARSLISPMWVEERRKAWGESHPFWTSKVLGQFPAVSQIGMIPPALVLAAQARTLAPSLPNQLGVDVGGGGDPTVIAQRRGPVVRVVHTDQEPDTMKTCGMIKIWLDALKASVAKIDVINLGRGVVDRGKELGFPYIGVNVSEKPIVTGDVEQFPNKRSQYYFGLRQRFVDGDIDLDPEDQDTAAEIVALRAKPNSRGQMVVEKKEDIKKRLGHSPDRVEAIMLAFSPEEYADATNFSADVLNVETRPSKWTF